MSIEPHQRQAYSLSEVAQMFGRHRSWAYRQVRAGRIITVTGFGRELVPLHEVERILNAGKSHPEQN